MNGNSGTNWIKNIFCNTSTLLEQPLLLHIIVTVVWSECNIFVCYLCTVNWCIFIGFVMCENTDITFCYVIPVDYHIVVSVCCTVLMIKSQYMQQLMYNCSMRKAFVGLEVQLLALWVIENLWLTVVREERNFVTTRKLIVAFISAEATTSSQTEWSQQNISVTPVICDNQQLSKCSVTVSVLSGSVILLRSLLLVHTVWWNGITDKNVMEGRISKRALQAI
jgi:hypothetical protein